MRSASLTPWKNGSLAIALVSIAGLVALLLPFIVASASPLVPLAPSRTVEASLLLAVIVAGALTIALAEIVRKPGAESLSRSIALLGTLVAVDATLRLVPSFLGASPIFALIILVGYVFGAPFGFMMGSLTLLLSAVLTAGIGPWLPFQMLCAGWMGVGAGLLPRSHRPLVSLVVVALYGMAAGFLFGAVMNLYSWPLAAPGISQDVGLYWSQGLSLAESLQRYSRFYLVTSLVHDSTRAFANLVLILIAGGPTIRLLLRFRSRMMWSDSAPTGH